MPEVRRPVAFLILGVLCAQFLVLGLVQASRDSVAVDEGYGLTSALVIAERRDVRLLPEHALLHNALAGVLPSLLADPVLPDTPAYADGDWFAYTEDLIRANDELDRLDELIFWYRVVPLLLAAGTGVVVYALASRLVGRGGALVSAGLWLTTPYVVGLGHLGALDVSFTFMIVLVALAVDRYRTSPTSGRLVALGASVGAALATRHTALALVPVVLLLVAWCVRRAERRAQLLQLGLALLAPLATVWLLYRLVDPSPVQGAPRMRFDALIASASQTSPLHRLVLAVPFPVEWRAGLAYLFETSTPRPAYSLGESWTGGRVWYFPMNALVKLPASFWVLVVAGGAAWVTDRVPGRRRLAWVLSPALALALFLLAQPLNLGLRLTLPIIASACLLSAGVLCLRRPVAAVVVVVCIAGQVAATIVAQPESLAWTPPPFTNGYRHVSDSSIDLGQAARAVQRAHEDTPFVAATLLLPLGLEVPRDVPSVSSLDSSELVGRLAVSATMLTVLERESLSWLRAYCPVDVIGRSVLVYEFEAPPDTSPGPVTPDGPCPGSPSSRRP